MEIDIQIRNASLEEAREIFSRAPEGTGYKIITTAVVPPEDQREKNLARSTIPGDELATGPHGIEPLEDKPTGGLPAETPPVQKKVPAVVKKKSKRESACDKFGIPPELRSTDPKKYGRIYWRCRVKGLTYDEALKAEDTTPKEKKAAPAPAKKTKQAGHSKKCPWCEIVMNTRLLHFHARKEHAEQYDKSGLSAYIAGKNIIPQTVSEPAEKSSEERSRIDKPPSDIKTHSEREVVKKPFPPPATEGTAALPSKEPVMESEWPDDEHDISIEGADELVDKMPEERPPTTGDPGKVYRNPRNPVPVRDPPEEFKIGLHVRQTKPFQDRIVQKVGIITARVGGLIEVNFGGTRYVKVAPDCLEVV